MAQKRKNNFDLIRFLAAMQVLILHAREHLKTQSEILDNGSMYFLSFFPGVPIFFFISGFLIYGSFERNSDNLRQFFLNRALRIFPALWICLVVTITLLLLDSSHELSAFFTKEVFAWLIGQLSVFQFYTPDILRFWGVGTPNGSLWTITVEIQFYLLIPVLYLILNKINKFWFGFVLIFLLSIYGNYFIGDLKATNESLISKLGAVSILAYLYYFLIGIFAKVFWKNLKPYFEHKFFIWFLAYLGFIAINSFFFDVNVVSYWIKTPLKIVADFLMAGVVFSLAYSFYGLSEKLLKGNDISYGLYIYHMLVVNFLVQRNCIEHWGYLLTTMLATIIIATLSWKLVEKPSLKLKYVFSKKNEKSL